MKEQLYPIQNNTECEKIIQGTFHGIMVFSSNGAEPYGIPLNHAYDDGMFYFHCGISGKKIDYLKRNPQVAYIIQKYYGSPDKYEHAKKCHGHWESVIAYGMAKYVEDQEELRQVLTIFMKYYGKDHYEPSEKALTQTRAITLQVTEMTARREVEKNKTEYYLWKKERA